jgi:hypothetical protein
MLYFQILKSKTFLAVLEPEPEAVGEETPRTLEERVSELERLSGALGGGDANGTNLLIEHQVSQIVALNRKRKEGREMLGSEADSMLAQVQALKTKVEELQNYLQRLIAGMLWAIDR